MNIEQTAAELHRARAQGVPPPLPSKLMDLDDAGAYALQKAFVRLQLDDDRIAGYKVGATSEAVRRSLGLAAPLTGVLPVSGERAAGEPVATADFGRLLIETEISFRAGSVIDAPVADRAELRTLIPMLAPAFELADVGFYGEQPSTGLDLIAANAACASWICGAWVSWQDLDPNALQVHLSVDGELRYEGRGEDSFGDQLTALRYLVNQVVAQGYRIEPGQIFLTGALGQPLPGKPGRYLADYGPLGELTLDLR